jgi:hypothetical protein
MPVSSEIVKPVMYLCVRGINFEIISTVFDQTLEVFRQSYVLCFILFYIPFCHYRFHYLGWYRHSVKRCRVKQKWVNRRRTDNTMTKRKRTKGQTTIYKTLPCSLNFSPTIYISRIYVFIYILADGKSLCVAACVSNGTLSLVSKLCSDDLPVLCYSTTSFQRQKSFYTSPKRCFKRGFNVEMTFGLYLPEITSRWLYKVVWVNK